MRCLRRHDRVMGNTVVCIVLAAVMFVGGCGRVATTGTARPSVSVLQEREGHVQPGADGTVPNAAVPVKAPPADPTMMRPQVIGGIAIVALETLPFWSEFGYLPRVGASGEVGWMRGSGSVELGVEHLFVPIFIKNQGTGPRRAPAITLTDKRGAVYLPVEVSPTAIDAYRPGETLNPNAGGLRWVVFDVPKNLSHAATIRLTASDTSIVLPLVQHGESQPIDAGYPYVRKSELTPADERLYDELFEALRRSVVDSGLEAAREMR